MLDLQALASVASSTPLSVAGLLKHFRMDALQAVMECQLLAKENVLALVG